MPDTRYDASRSFLKDTIRQQIDFSRTGQNRHQPAPPLQKPCPPGTPTVSLPDGRSALASLAQVPLCEAITRRESLRTFASPPLTLDELSALLWATQGVRTILTPSSAHRVVPSAGARHTFETYLAVSRVNDLAAGLYRYLPFGHQLAQLREDDEIGRHAAEACLRQAFIAEAAVTFFWTTVPSRMEWRYDLSAHKAIALDAGHVCQNLYLACQGIGAGTCAVSAYDQEACDRLLGVDGEEEFTVYLAPVGKR